MYEHPGDVEGIQQTEEDNASANSLLHNHKGLEDLRCLDQFRKMMFLGHRQGMFVNAYPLLSTP